MVRCEDDRTPGNLDNVLGSNYMWSSMITVDTLVVVHHTAQGAGITYIQSWGSFCNIPLVELKTHIVILVH